MTNSCDEYDDNEALDQSEIESLDDDDLDNSYTDSERYDDEDDRDDLRGTSQCDGTCEPQCDWCLVSHSCSEDCAGGTFKRGARGGNMSKDSMPRADVVAILRGLASKFQDERDKQRADERRMSCIDPDAATECRGWAGACHNHANIVRKLADEIERGAK